MRLEAQRRSEPRKRPHDQSTPTENLEILSSRGSPSPRE
jgi:hypothetical protein